MRLLDRTGSRVRVRASGRVNLIGDHTDYMGGLAMPMAIDLAVEVDALVGGSRVELRSGVETDMASFEVPVHHDAARALRPAWARYPAAVAAGLGARVGIRGTVTSTIPPGSGLSSSAALEVAIALALGADGPVDEVASICREAEEVATSVPCGIMDQLAILAGRPGHATMVDCSTRAVTEVPMPPELAVWVLESGVQRRLEGSGYAERRSAAQNAEALVGPLPRADLAAIEAIEDPVLRRRARHVRTECGRVAGFRHALESGDHAGAGLLMVESHRSLRDDYDVSVPELDSLVNALCATDGVHGARLTGAGFGGCVVALADPGVDLTPMGSRFDGLRVEATGGPSVDVD